MAVLRALLLRVGLRLGDLDLDLDLGSCFLRLLELLVMQFGQKNCCRLPAICGVTFTHSP
jgi:hypothetical protein